MLYFPAPDAGDKLFLDYGCYFFDLPADGSFKGYSVGFDYKDGKLSFSEHNMKRIG